MRLDNVGNAAAGGTTELDETVLDNTELGGADLDGTDLDSAGLDSTGLDSTVVWGRAMRYATDSHSMPIPEARARCTRHRASCPVCVSPTCAPDAK
jgi:hypothetical protein